MTPTLIGHAVILANDFNYTMQQYWLHPVYDDGTVGGPIPGPVTKDHDLAEEEGRGFDVDAIIPIAVAPDGSFMVAQMAYGGPFLDQATFGLFPWNGTSFDLVPTHTIVPLLGGCYVAGVGITPDGQDMIFAGGNGSDTAPYVAAYPVSLAGFGTKYADPVDVPDVFVPVDPDFDFLGIFGFDIHPSGLAVALSLDAASGSCVFGVWHYTPGVGWGARYPNPADVVSQAGTVQFARNGVGERLLVLSADDVADGYFRVYDFDLVTGIGAKLAPSPAPIPLYFSWQGAFNGSIIVTGSWQNGGSVEGLINYPLIEGVIGPGSVFRPSEAKFIDVSFSTFDRSGRYLYATGQNQGGLLLKANPDGTLARHGPMVMMTNSSSGWDVTGWRT